MEEPLIISGKLGDTIFDLSIMSADDCIKEINKAYAMGKFINENLTQIKSKKKAKGNMLKEELFGKGITEQD